MPNNYILLETIALTQSAASVTFDNLPTSGYTDLKIVVSARSTANGGQNMNLTFNSNTSGYSDRILSGNGSAASSFTSGNTSRGGSCVMPGADFTANTFGNGEIYIPNYRGSNAKSFSSDSVSENNATLSYNQMQATLWNNSAAITNILIDLSGGSFAAGSTFSLYGIAALGTTPVLAPKATGGNRVENDGTYWIHTFLTSGNFVPQVGLTCDVLVVAGGGGGGGASTGNTYAGGGGGAGGFRALTAQAVSNGTNYPVTIGAGGSGGAVSTNGAKGNDSVFSTITSTGGGFGALGNLSANNGGAGGSGGASTNGGTGGAASPSGEGNAGATSSVTFGSSGGGGGASAAGSNVTSGVGGAGGNGTANSYSGSSVTYAGGAGGGGYSSGAASSNGGMGGTGGGGNGGASAVSFGQVGTAGTANTGGAGGGGGGGSGGGAVGSAGGSGIVIIRYPIN